MTSAVLEKPIAKVKSMWSGVFIESAKWTTPVTECTAEEPVEVVKDEAPVWTMPVFETNEIKFTMPSPPVGFYNADFAKPMSDWASVALGEMARAYARPAQSVGAEVVVRFKEAVRDVITEAGISHVCRPHQVGDMAMMRYIHEGQGDCLVGRALVRMGYSPEEISRYEGSPAYMAIPGLIGHNEELVRIAQDVQAINDSRLPWNEALRYVA